MHGHVNVKFTICRSGHCQNVKKAIKYFYSYNYGLTCQLENKIRGKLDIKIWARHVSGTHQETRKSSLKADLESQKLSSLCRHTEPCITQLQKLGLHQ